MCRLILCEKPSVALAIAYCVGATDKVSDGKRFYWQGNGFIVTNALGHLVGIGVPEDYREGTIRITLGKYNTEQEVKKIAKILIKVLSI